MTTVNNENLYQILQSRFPTEPEAPSLILLGGRVVRFGLLQPEAARLADRHAALSSISPPAAP